MPPAFSFPLLLAAAMTGSLAIKAQTIDYRVASDGARLTADIRGSLGRAGIPSTVEHRKVSQVDTVVGRRGNCSIRLSDGTRANERASVFTRQAGGLGAPRYFYAGEWSKTPPMFRSEVVAILQRSLARIGIDTGRPVILAVSASAACPIESIDLGNVRMHLTVPKP